MFCYIRILRGDYEKRSFSNDSLKMYSGTETEFQINDNLESVLIRKRNKRKASIRDEKDQLTNSNHTGNKNRQNSSDANSAMLHNEMPIHLIPF